MEYRASLRYIRITPRKLRLVADLIRGKNVQEAQAILNFFPRRGAYFLGKLLKSAIANAEQKPEVNVDQLKISQLQVEAGPMLKRWRAAPRGRAVPIKKRTSQVTIILTESGSTPREKK